MNIYDTPTPHLEEGVEHNQHNRASTTQGGGTPPNRKKRWWILSLILVIALALAAGVVFFLFRGGVTMTPTQPLEKTVAPTTGFTIALRKEISAEELRKEIQFQPPINFVLEQQEDNTFLLTPAQVLTAGTGLDVTVQSKTFSFTVANQLVVTSYFPTEDSENVPINTGVEFFFNTEGISQEAFTSAFQIDPPMEGNVWNMPKGFGFSSEGTMYYDTEYTITLSGDLTNAAGATLGEDFVLKFRTYSEEFEMEYDAFHLSSTKAAYNFMPDELPFLELYLVADPAEEVKAQVELFKIPTAEEYIRQLEVNNARSMGYYNPLEPRIETQGLSSYATMELPLLPKDNPYGYYDNYRLLEFPEPLEKGWYAVEISVDYSAGNPPITRRALFQVSDLSVFYMLVDQEMMAWVNNTTTGAPVEGAEFQLAGAYNTHGTTGPEGIAQMEEGFYSDENNSGARGGIFTVSSGEDVFIDTEEYQYNDTFASKTANQFISYLYTDRSIYRTTDTIQCWGMFRPRKSDTPLPDNLSLEIDDGAVRVPIELAADGTFTATMEYSYLTDDYWKAIRMVGKVGDETVRFNTTYVRVEDYVKPVYTGSSESLQPVYTVWQDNKAQVAATVTTFDGTPSPQMEFILSGDEQILPENLTVATNAMGRTEVELSLDNIEEQPTGYPQGYYYGFSSSGPADEPFSLSNTLYVIHRDLLLEGTPDYSQPQPSVEITTHSIDTSRISRQEDLWEKNSLRGDTVDTEVTAQLHKVTYEKTVTGSYYDYINKVEQETYKYVRKDTLIDTFHGLTQGGSFTLTDLPVAERGGYHYLMLTADDSRGKPVETKVYLGYARDMQGAQDSLVHNYGLSKQVETSQIEAQFVDGHWQEPNLWEITNRFQDGEDTRFQLTDNDEVLPEFEGRILYAVVQDGIIKSGVSDSTVALSFEENLVPNYILSGAYFDGKRVFMLQDNYMDFSAEKRQLDIQLDTDKDSYGPSDQMKVTATVTDVEGNAMPKTQVLLSVVDEAIFAMQEQYPNFLSSIYQGIYYPNIYKYGSYRQQSGGGAERGGGGGGDAVRTDFLDTAEFSVVETDSAGKAELTVQLPDNITSWRLTSLALTPQNFAGDTKDNRVVTRPFFVLPVLPRQILSGDTLAVGLRSAGTSVSATTETTYTVQLKGEGVKETREIALRAQEYGTVRFENLALGDYSVTIHGTAGEHSDALTLLVSSIASGNEVSLSRTLPLQEVAKEITPLRYPVSLTIYDKQQEFYQSVIESIRWDVAGNRTDMRLARRWLGVQFEESGTSWYDDRWRTEDMEDITTSGMLSVFTYSQPDIEFTVKAHLATPSLVNADTLKEINHYSDYTGSPTMIYLAKALSHQPIAEDLAYILDHDDSLQYVEKIYLATALYVSGEEKAARKYYNTLVKDNSKKYELLSGKEAYYIELLGEDSDACTGAASILASLLQTKEAEGFVRTLMDKGSKKDPYIFERIIYLNNTTPTGSGLKVEYVMDGLPITTELKDSPLYLTLNKEQLEQANFSYNGEVWADVAFAAKAGEGLDPAQEKIAITKKISKADGSGGTYRVGDLLKVEISLDFSGLEDTFGQNGVYVEDYIPTGMRYVGNEKDGFIEQELVSQNWNLEVRQGQRLRLGMYPQNPTLLSSDVPLNPYWEEEFQWTESNRYSYYVLCVTPGSYVVEGAAVNSRESDLWGMDSRSQVTIVDENE